jgi:hypothetical protein
MFSKRRVWIFALGLLNSGLLNTLKASKVEVQTGTYSAIRRLHGRSHHMVTKSGTNSVHGNLVEFIRNDLDRLDHRSRGSRGDQIVHDADAIERHAVLNFVRSGRQAHGVAPHHRKIGELSRGDDRGNGGVIRFDHLSRRFDGDGF